MFNELKAKDAAYQAVITQKDSDARAYQAAITQKDLIIQGKDEEMKEKDRMIASLLDIVE